MQEIQRALSPAMLAEFEKAERLEETRRAHRSRVGAGKPHPHGRQGASSFEGNRQERRRAAALARAK